MRKIGPDATPVLAGARPAGPEDVPTGPAPTGSVHAAAQGTSSAATAVVWVDGTTAIVARWADGPIVERVASDVPGHHRSTGHIRHDPAVRHGGGGIVAEQAERDRRLHRAQHLRRVAQLVPATCDVRVLGPGRTRLELAAALRAADGRTGRRRRVEAHASGRLTEGQLVAYLREAAGRAPTRRRVGRA